MIGPDIAYSVSVVSQFMSASWTSHWDIMVRILRYLKSAPGRELLFSDCGHNRIVGFSDVDSADCPIDKKSTTRYYVFVGGNLVS